MRISPFLFVVFYAIPPAVAAEAEFGVTGLTFYETARLSAFCSEHLALGRAAEPCEVTFTFHSTEGRDFRQATLTLPFGTGGSLDLRGSDVAARGSTVEIVPCLKIGRGAVVVTFQTFDNFTLRTNLLVNWSDRSVHRSGEIDFGMAGLTAFDTGRLSASCPDDLTPAGQPPDPCNVTLIFHDVRGRVLKQSQMTLPPGTSASVDLRASEAGLTSSRGEIVPCIKVGRGMVIGGFRLLDNLTGHTNALVHPAAGLFAPPPV